MLGKEVKKYRNNKKLTQAELAEGICTQVTVSKMENHDNLPTINILSKICDRLEINIEDVTSDESDNNRLFVIFKKVDQLIIKMNHAEALEFLTTNIEEDEVEHLSSIDKKKYFYYRGYLLITTKNDIYEGAFYLDLASNEMTTRRDLTDVLIKAARGIMYFEREDPTKAKQYFELAISDLNAIDVGNQWREAIKTFFNTAKCYSELKEYGKAIECCDAGIKITKEHESNYMLDLLLYEKGFNLYYTTKEKSEVERLFFMAMGFGMENNNTDLIKNLKADSKEFKLKYDYYNL